MVLIIAQYAAKHVFKSTGKKHNLTRMTTLSLLFDISYICRQ